MSESGVDQDVSVFAGVMQSTESLKEHAGHYSNGCEILVGELNGITHALASVMEAFSGPSIVSQLMMMADSNHENDPVLASSSADDNSSSAVATSTSRKGLRGQRKPGAQLLWPGLGVDEKDMEGLIEQGAGTHSTSDVSSEVANKAPQSDLAVDELIGNSILVQLAPGEDICEKDVDQDMPEKLRESLASGAASRAVTRPQTTIARFEDADNMSEYRDHLSGAVGDMVRQVGMLEYEETRLNETASDPIKADRHYPASGLRESMPPDIAEYLDAKDELLAWIRKHGIESLKCKKENICGLRNQGATCYMNSLLQTLYQCPEFRAFVNSWQHDEKVHGPKSTCIPAQLQELFGSMASSESSSITTDTLTSSFGWGASSAFHQHDASELLHKLFDALEKATTDFEGVRSLFQGTSVNYIGCPERQIWREKDEIFMTLQLQVQGLSTLEAALSGYVAPETMQGENMWRLDDGSLVSAVKGLWPKKLPVLLFLDMLRFKYGESGREKVNDRQSIPMKLNMADILDSSRPKHEGSHEPEHGRPNHEDCLQACNCAEGWGEGVYDLVAILLHRGTAQGGHYCACVREWKSGGEGQDRWLYCNDENVSRMSQEELDDVLFQNGSVDMLRGFNAYMLLYRRKGLSDPPQELLEPGTEILAGIQRDNEAMSRLRKLYEVHERVCEIRISHVHLGGDGDQLSFSIVLPKSTSLEAAVLHVREKALAQSWPEQVVSKIRDGVCRLRRYDMFSTYIGETFGGRESRCLEELGLCPVSHLLLEVRGETDPLFTEYDDWYFKLGKWPSNHDAEDDWKLPIVWVDIAIRKRLGASVGELSKEALLALSVPVEDNHILLIYCRERGRECKVVWDSAVRGGNDVLLESSGVERGGNLVVEVLPQCDDSSKTADQQSLSLEYYQRLQSSANMTFNHPSRPTTFPFSLDADLRWTLSQLKAVMASQLSIDPLSFHLRRSSKAAQLRDEAKTLGSLGLSDGSTIFLGEGPPRAEGQVLLKITLLCEGDDKDALFQVTAGENDTVATLKTSLAQRISKMKIPPPSFRECESSLIRLRDKKGKEIGKILKDHLTLKRALPRLSDGREVAAQMLSVPETVQESDIILQARIWDVAAQILLPAREVVISKNATHQELRDHLIKSLHIKFSDLDHIRGGMDSCENLVDTKENIPRLGIAKASTFGPPPDLSAVSRLKWSAYNETASKSLSEAPLSLRDGSVLILRDEWEYALTIPRPPSSASRGVIGRGKGNFKKTGNLANREESRRIERDLKISVWGEQVQSHSMCGEQENFGS